MYDMKKVLLWLFVVILAVGGGAYWFTNQDSSQEDGKKTNVKTEEMKKDEDSNDKKAEKETEKSSEEEKVVDVDVEPVDMSDFYTLWSENKLEDAKKALEGYMKKHPRNVPLHLEAAEFFMGTEGSPHTAISTLESFTKANGEHPDILVALSDYYILSGSKEDVKRGLAYAEKAWNQADQEDSQEVVKYAPAYAWALGAAEKFDESIALYEGTILPHVKVAENPTIHYHYALVQDMAGHEEKSEEVFQTLLSLKAEDIKNEEVRFELGLLQETIQLIQEMKKEIKP